MADKRVFVSDEGGLLEVLPSEIRVKFGRDTLELVNGTAKNIEWTVEEGAFTNEIRGRKVLANLGKSGKQKPKKGTEANFRRFVVFSADINKSSRWIRRNDPIIIIET